MGDKRAFSMGDSAHLNPRIWPPLFYSKLYQKSIAQNLNNSSRSFVRMPSFSGVLATVAHGTDKTANTLPKLKFRIPEWFHPKDEEAKALMETALTKLTVATTHIVRASKLECRWAAAEVAPTPEIAEALKNKTKRAAVANKGMWFFRPGKTTTPQMDIGRCYRPLTPAEKEKGLTEPHSYIKAADR